MNRITATIEALRARGEGAFMPFLVVGDPDVETSLRLTGALVDAGADILEFGFAFSDPPADGPVIQAADERALAAGMTPPKAFAFLDEVKRRWGKPVALLMYYNLLFQYGLDAFYARCAEAGVDAVLVADVPLEESGPLVEAAARHGVAPVFIASELTTDARLAKVSAVAGAYLYAVARLGTTGEQVEVDPALAGTLARFRAGVSLPVLAGFGISQPAHVRAVLASGADGAIVGSALVRLIDAHLDDPDTMVSAVGDLARRLKNATRGENKTC